MERQKEKRGGIFGGIMLILVGTAFLAWTLAPLQMAHIFGPDTWPLIIIGVGAAFLLAGLVLGAGGFLIPGSIITGVGTLLAYQNLTGNWASWAYAWPLMPGLVGVGLFLGSLIDPGMRDSRKVGLYMASIGFIVFAVMWALFTASINLNYLWPVILILVGLGLLLRASFKPRS